ncbi:uncharacterized protein LOC120204024 [Hibiscus syriacus]|uniref:uncharacterized protein LOC120204024 n=1 Tax=Hibiscus syriacus TaxID=106335 RepID=UPI001924DFDD|nr:uncharacterized protein LOC120204024 [Hibiscus syriacus]
MREEARRLFYPSANWLQIKGCWIWDNIRERKEKVSWHRLVWFPAHVPKFSLISWMSILDRLPTNDKLARFGMVADNVCGLCEIGMKSRNHLFLECSYAREVWGAIMHSCGLQQSELHCWEDNLRWMVMNMKGKSLLV